MASALESAAVYGINSGGAAAHISGSPRPRRPAVMRVVSGASELPTVATATTAGRTTDLSLTLAMQETALRDRRREIDRILTHVRRVRARLAAGEMLSTTELIAAARDTTAPPPSWQERIMGHYRHHLGEATLARLTPGDPEVWLGLLAELRTLSAADVAPEAPIARDFFRRWIVASEAVSGGDPEINRQAHAAWMEAIQDPSSAATLPLGKAEIDYLTRLAADLDGSHRLPS